MKAVLTSRSGARRYEQLVIHAPAHLFGGTACRRTFEELRAQEYLVHQTALSADLSDVDCPACLEVMAPASRIYPQACTSAYCGRAREACPSCPRFGARWEFEAWRELRKAHRPDEVWCPSYWQATTTAGGGR